MNGLHQAAALGLLLLLGGQVCAQQPGQMPSDTSRQNAPGKADTLRNTTPPPTRPDTTQFNSADPMDPMRTPQPAATPTVPQGQPQPSDPELPAAATRNGTVQGQLVVAQNGQNRPVEFASIGLFSATDSSSVGGGLSNEKGQFVIDNLPPGNYYILVQSLGFAARTIPNVTITAQQPTVSLGSVSLNETARQLEEVVVQGQRQLIDYALDRKIVNVDQLPTALGGTATDILQNVPSVTIDADGVLSLRGSSNVLVFVDGKPSGLTGLDREAVLEQIPASNIERVEIITNPSSRYDADGAAGIINIILKKQQAQGFNGNVQLNVGTRDKYNASINLNYRIKNLNLFGSYNFRDERRFSYRNSDRQNLFENDSTSFLLQRNDGFRSGVNNNMRFGLDYNLTKRDNITASVLYRPQYDRDVSSETINTLNSDRTSLGQILRLTEEREPERGFDYVFGYARTFEKPGRKLNFDATLSTNNSIEYTDYQLSTDLPAYLITPNLRAGRQESTNDENNRVSVLQLDFVEPFGGKKRFEAGLKQTNRYQNADYVFLDYLYGFPVLNTNISNNFVYDERTSAAYVNFGDEFKTFSYQLGVRTEYTNIITDQRTTAQRNTRDYIYLFPSAFFNYNISKEQKMQVNYSRRINRPSQRALNPFIDLSDPLNIRFGNPFLNPELINSFEVSHLWYGKSTSLTSSLFFRRSTNDVTRFQTLRPDGVTEQTFLNLNRSQNYGLEVVVSQDILKWWKANGTFSFFRANIQPGPGVPEGLNRSNQSWTARLNSTLSPWKGTDMQVTVNYRSPFIVAQGTINGFFNVDFGLKQNVLKGRGSINFRVSDIFNTLQFSSDTFGSNFIASSVSKRESRIAFIGFSYRLSRQVSRDRERDRDERRDDQDNGDDEF